VYTHGRSCVCVCTHKVDTGWRRLIGSPSLQVIFHKRATNYRALWRKVTYEDKASYDPTPPCTVFFVCTHSGRYFVCVCTHIVDTGRQRLIGSPKSQVIFHKRATKYRSLWRKMTYEDKGSYEFSPPCTVFVCVHTVVDTGWRRLVGSPELQVIFHKRATKCRSLFAENDI